MTSLSGTDGDRSFAPVPEPGAAVLLLGGLAGLAAARLRRRSGRACATD